MRVALVAESFLPHMNGVTHSLLRVIDHLAERGDDVVVIAPQASATPTELHGYPVTALPAFSLPSYPNVRLAAGSVARLSRILGTFRPEVVHLASPFVLGWRALRAAERLGVATVAVYQTDVPAYATRYGFPRAESLLWDQVRRIHGRATLNLAPSGYALAQLADQGIPRTRLWVRGVDADRFSPARRDESWRRRIAPGGERIIGYVGRLATEKQVQDLRVLVDVPGTRLVIVGDGPQRSRLQRLLPGAVFLGFLSGTDLATAVAGFDVFVHPGELETFCQTIQEAMASGVPVVATGQGGPVDLVDSSRTGWLYRPGDLSEFRERVTDLTGDETKRRAFGAAARTAVAPRTWKSVCGALIGHYSSAIESNVTVPGRGLPTPPTRPAERGRPARR